MTPIKFTIFLLLAISLGAILASIKIRHGVKKIFVSAMAIFAFLNIFAGNNNDNNVK